MNIKQILHLNENSKSNTFYCWVRNNRSYKALGFLDVFDGSNTNGIQIVYKDNLKNFKEITELLINSAIKVTGSIKVNNRNNTKELSALEITILKESDKNSEFQKKTQSVEYLRTITHLRPKAKLFQTVFKLRSDIFNYVNKFFMDNQFLNLHAPIITANDAEGLGEVFNIYSKDAKNFFNREAYLGVSGQLFAEAYAQSFKKVYTFAPTFRADKSNTVRHVAEFWMIEPEVAFSDLKDNIQLAEKFLKYIIKTTLENNLEELKLCEQNFEADLISNLKIYLKEDFAQVTYTEALKIINDQAKDSDKELHSLKWGEPLLSEHEKFLADTWFKRPTFVFRFPATITPFYMKFFSEDKTSGSMDLLVPNSGELIGGSQREDDYDLLLKNIKKNNIDLSSIKWYLDLRKNGYYKSSGFGVGFERLVMLISGVKNIKDVVPFPRTYKNLII